MYREVLEEAKAFESLPEEFVLAEEEKGERSKLDEKVLQAFGVSQNVLCFAFVRSEAGLLVFI